MAAGGRSSQASSSTIERSRAFWKRNAAVAGPCTGAVVMSIVIAVSGLRGNDYPAHLLRELLWDQSGFGVWNNYWYGGHGTPTYSVLTPPLSALLGTFLLIALSSVAAVYCFSRLTTALLPGRSTALANYAFAMGAIVNVVVGRAPFALGWALALAALLAWQRQSKLAIVVAFLTPFASPVAATYLAIAGAAVALAAWWPERRRRRLPSLTVQAVGLVAATLLPIVAMAVVFPSPGRFPFRGDHFVISLLAMGLLAAVHRSSTVRIGCALVASVSIAVFLVPNPLGGNFLRLTQMSALPLLVTAWPAVRRRWTPLFAALLTGVLVWTAHPGLLAAFQWAGDESVHAAYHEPLIEQVRTRNSDGLPIGRLEVPFTDNHWESYYVAPEVPFARGWERQVDLERNEILYGDPDVDGYHRWVQDNAVRWIAIPDVVPDEGGTAEVAFFGRTGEDIPWLEMVWQNDDWWLYEVTDYVPIVDRPARLLGQTADTVTIRSDTSADVTVRYRYANGTTIDNGACVTPGENGWIVARLPGPGDYTISVDVSEMLDFAGGDVDCAR